MVGITALRRTSGGVKNRFNQVFQAMLNGTGVKYYRDPDMELWWSADTEGHGGSAWKVMAQVGNILFINMTLIFTVTTWVSTRGRQGRPYLWTP
jgi:hypothetical protein